MLRFQTKDGRVAVAMAAGRTRRTSETFGKTVRQWLALAAGPWHSAVRGICVHLAGDFRAYLRSSANGEGFSMRMLGPGSHGWTNWSRLTKTTRIGIKVIP